MTPFTGHVNQKAERAFWIGPEKKTASAVSPPSFAVDAGRADQGCLVNDLPGDIQEVREAS